MPRSVTARALGARALIGRPSPAWRRDGAAIFAVLERRRSKAPLQRQLAAASMGNLKSFDSSSIYEARAVAAGLPFCFSAAIRVFAAGPEECGFCPVISRPLLTT
ncbi:hypothetical protein SAMN05444158_7267 [Bradyrhizobium canariense]|uniref:Uncharacterized protein n=1 Tax=Bradyrhizobium canariense TaxID=255045 RepID=A0A1H2BJQ1_9BRAD|nr:hypothetical protein SAMN05444158_7267 [Bradyrhizobium canariense]